MDDKTISLLDSTLRDGAQGLGISFSVQDKLHIVEALDELGVDYIEAGNPGSNPKDLEFFERIRSIRLETAKVAAFGSTRRKGIGCAEDANLQSLIAAGTETVVIFGKTWDFQVEAILQASREENIDMIADTVRFLRGEGRTVIFDAEHFFDGYLSNPDFALDCLEAAASEGASILTLCETKGGMLPWQVEEICRIVYGRFGSRVQIGIHTHNDCGLGVANSLAAVQSGALHVQGTLIGFGERTGNANLSTIIGDLELKMGRRCLPESRLERLTPICRRVAEISNITLETGMPFVSNGAFAHKAGMHIDAVTKTPVAYEHVTPESVGNNRSFLMSEVAGRATILERIRRFDPSITKDTAIVSDIVAKMKAMEHEGYQFEGAEGSFELLVRKHLGKYQPFFILHYYKIIGEKPPVGERMCSFAQLKIEVDNRIEVTAGEGEGPVHALDTALRKALERFYPSVSDIRLTDYKVRVLGSATATASKVRVLIESTDGNDSWTTVGVSADIMEASWLALVDSFEYKLIKDLERRYRSFL